MHAGQLRRNGSLSAESILIALIAVAAGVGVGWSFLNGKVQELDKAQAAWGDYPDQIMDGLMNGQQAETPKPLIQLPEVKLPDWKLPQLPQFQPQQPQQTYDYQPEMRYPQPPCAEYRVDRNLYGPDEVYCFID